MLDLLDKFLAQSEVKERLKNVKDMSEITGPNGVVTQFVKRFFESTLKGEMDAHLGYPPYAVEGRNSGNSRNGYSGKTVATSQGDVNLEIPRDRSGTFEPKLIQKHKNVDPELEKKIISMYAKGMTTRDMADHLSELYCVEVSAQFISTVTNRIMESVMEWRSRPLPTVIPVVFFDALFFKTRHEGKIYSRACYVALGLTIEGKAEVLGLWICEAEGAHFWLGVLSDLKSRGVSDILIACVDGLQGFPQAIETLFPKTVVQQCIVHQIRNSLRYVGSKHQKEFLADLKPIYKAPDMIQAENFLQRLDEKWGEKYPAAIESWKRNWERLSAHLQYPEPIRKLIYTTNIVEAFHRRVRKVTKNRGVMANDDAVIKLVYLVIRDIERKTKMAKQGWAEILSQLRLLFGDRVPLKLQ